MSYYIYCITHRLSNRKYIGKTNDAKGRWSAHKRAANRGSISHFHLALKKYGIENFDFEVLEECVDENTAYEREHQLIVEHRTMEHDYGFNMNEGGQGGCNPSEETRKKLRLRKYLPQSSGWKWTDEMRRRASNTHKGKVISAESREKNRLAHLGRVTSEETKAKLRAKSSNFKHSIESRMKMSESQKGHSTSQEARTKMSIAHTGKTLTDIHKLHISESLLQSTKIRKLTKANVVEIRRLLDEGTSIESLVEMFHVSSSTIRRIRDRKMWKHVK